MLPALGSAGEGAGGGREGAGTDPPAPGGAARGGRCYTPRWAVKQRRNLCYFTAFQFYDPGSSVLGSEDLRGKMVRPVLWHCTAAGEGEESTVIFLIQT